ncbi:MAG: hypothetical protein ACKOC5_11940 [Chloroflexota bacterium]
MKYVALVISLVLLAYLVMDFNTRMADLNRLRAEQEAVNARLKSYTETLTALKKQIAYATSEAAVNEWAYENHYAKPGDYVVVPAQVLQVTPTPQPRPVVQTKVESNFQRWLALFFD